MKSKKVKDTAVLGVARMDAERSYRGIAPLLQTFIRKSDREAWKNITQRIDYTFKHLDSALSALDRETDFLSRIKELLDQGRKILFKPNIVSGESINPYMLTTPPGNFANTEWAFVAAVMRWFHDKAGISYYSMVLGEASSTTTTLASSYTHIKNRGIPVTTEAVIEGRSEDFYGGWGFYFARKYLSETSDPAMGDDPMNGLEESMEGITLPPGKAGDKLMVYDLNKVSDDPSKGREVQVPGAENFTAILLHKVIVGGDPSDADDMANYPGCVLINLPKLKVHSQSFFTNAIKNLGIGLYPMHASRSHDCRWEYATPYTSVPALKNELPHQVWVPEMDRETNLPRRNSSGKYIVRKTGGLTGTMLDIIRMLADQEIFTLNIVDAIEAVNRDHTGIGLGIAEPEGLVVAGTDMVATDLFCARYLFSNVGNDEAESSGLKDRFGGSFVQSVPVPVYNGKEIITQKGYDCALSRDHCLLRAEKEGLGSADYRVVGHDAVTGKPLTSLKGRLGFQDEKGFHEIVTKSLFWDIFKMPWDMQKTFLAYLEAVDELEKTSLKKDFMDAFDEDGDGVVSYEEYGKKGLFGSSMLLSGIYISLRGAEDESALFKAYFDMTASNLRYSIPQWNEEKHDFNRERFFGNVTTVAYMMSQSPKERPDPFLPGLNWGNGKWPSYSLALSGCVHQMIYGWKFPSRISVFSLYGSLVACADHRQNGRQFVGTLRGIPDPKAIVSYLEAVREDKMKPFDFTLFVPPGYGAQGNLPHVQETSDPDKIFTAII